MRTAHWAGRTTEKSKSHTFLCKSMTFIRFSLPCHREVPSAARRRDSCPSAGAAAYKARPVGIPPAACGVHLPLTREAQRVKKHRLCYIENVGATIGRPPAWRSNALLGKLLTRRTGTGEQCSPLQEFFDSLHLPLTRDAFCPHRLWINFLSSPCFTAALSTTQVRNTSMGSIVVFFTRPEVK